MPNALTLTDELYTYLLAHSTPLDDIAEKLVEETRAALPGSAKMQVSPEQVGLLTMLTQLVGVRRAVEVGTFTGLSSLAIARGLSEDGRLICFDISHDYTAIARRFWERAGVADRIELRIGPASEALRALPGEPHLDLAFIDADKPNYWIYWRELVPRMRPGGLIAVDNVLWQGQVLQPAPDDVDALAIAQFNDSVTADDRVDVVMLPIADGITLARKR